MKNELSPELIRELLRYDAETGHLFWNQRSPELFSDTPRRSRSQNATWWNGRFAGKRACKPDAHQGYLRVGIFGNEYRAHRVIWAMETGAWPTETIDHADGDKANNKFPNLREATTSENNRNRANHGKSKFRGVSWRSRQSCWIAAITTDGKVTFLGSFEKEEDAARAYDRAAVIQHGEFARTNFPQSDYESRIRSALVSPPAVPGEVETDLVDRLIELADSIEALKLPDDAQTNGCRGFLMARKQAAELARNAAKDFDRSALSVPLPEVEGGDKGDGWQPIETAPKDGTSIDLWGVNHLTWDKRGERIVNVKWGAVSDWIGRERDDWQHGRGEDFEPTHWMPLPAAPSASIEGEPHV